MRPTPAVTVLMAVKDGERHLGEAIDSILAQTLADLELVIVEDGSTDDTAAILESYRDPRIRVLRNSRNLGLTRSLNRGLEDARAPYVARQDADDVSERERLERQVGFLDRNPEVALVASAYRRIDDDGLVTGRRPVPTNGLDIRWRLLFLNAFAHSSVVFRSNIVRRIGRYDESLEYAQDYGLWSRLAAAEPVAALPEELVRYRESAKSMTEVMSSGGEEIERISRENLRRLGGAGEGLASTIDRDAAWRLLVGGTGGLDAPRAVRAARQVLAVESSFAVKERLRGSRRLRHRARVALVLARSVAAVAARDRDRKAAVQATTLLAALLRGWRG